MYVLVCVVCIGDTLRRRFVFRVYNSQHPQELKYIVCTFTCTYMRVPTPLSLYCYFVYTDGKPQNVA